MGVRNNPLQWQSRRLWAGFRCFLCNKPQTQWDQFSLATATSESRHAPVGRKPLQRRISAHRQGTRTHRTAHFFRHRFFPMTAVIAVSGFRFFGLPVRPSATSLSTLKFLTLKPSIFAMIKSLYGIRPGLPVGNADLRSLQPFRVTDAG